MARFPELGWMEQFRERVNRDEELSVIGWWFTTTFMLEAGAVRYALRIREGKLVEVVPSPGLDVPCSFVVRAPIEVWERFLQPVPPPLYHDVFAMLMRVPEFQLVGDTLVAMQNVRALHRLLSLMREVGQSQDG